jgi:hypothetical protein
MKRGRTGFFDMVVEKIPKNPIVERSDMMVDFAFDFMTDPLV